VAVVGKKVMPRLLSVNVGLPRDIAWRGKTVRTAIWKTPVQGGAWYGGSTLTATGKGTWLGTAASTGPFSFIRSTPTHYWQSQLGRNDFTYGQFGENFTVDGLSDQEVSIGDRYRVGGALFEVTQPRVT
jgi:MOSC domain-containing protein YiiM